MPSSDPTRGIIQQVAPHSRLLRQAVFRHWTHNTAVLPYNLNWAIEPSLAEAAYLRRNPVVVCDVGARGDAPSELESLFPYIIYYGFDADELECARLNAESHRYAAMRIFPKYVGGTTGVTAFHLYADRARSSVYSVSESHVGAFGDSEQFRLDKTVEVDSTTLDEITASESLRKPDFLKLDTQGSELAILQNAHAVLESANLVEAEVAFTPIYTGRPLFHDVARFLTDEGYELLYLSRHFSQRKQFYRGPARGQPIWGDALFGRRANELRGASNASLVTYALLLINYGHIDLARQLTVSYPQIVKELPSIERHFATVDHGSRLTRVVVSQVDKVAMLWLHARRYNRFNNDSDRNWPVR